jgi:hypothetical protein
MKIKIYSPTRNPMQSGLNKTSEWLISMPAAAAPAIDPLMGWTGMPDTTQQITLRFATKEEAIEYASKNGLEFEVEEPKERVIKPKSYSANFAFKTENRA